MPSGSTGMTHTHQAFKAVLRLVREYPMAAAKLWHRDDRTSQRDAVQSVLTPELICAVLVGGNRSGKTEAGAQLAVAYAMGRDHPAVQSWGRVNGLDLTSIQSGSGVVCCSSLTGNDSRRIQRPKVERYLPRTTKWSNQYGHGEATARLPGGGTIIFKSNDQRARAYQGADWDFLWMDEEHDRPIFNEARMRLVDRSGRAAFTMTPLKGRSWVWESFISEPEPRSEVYTLHSEDNPYIPQEYLRALLARYGPHERAARARGEWTNMEGLVYPFDRSVHVCKAFDPDPEWMRLGGIDFGTRNPFVYLLVAVDPRDDVMHVYKCHHRTEWTLKNHADAIHEITDVWPQWIVADSEDRGSRLSLSREHDIITVPSKKGKGSVRAGVNAVCERLAVDATGKPHLIIHDHPSLRPMIKEFESYTWATNHTRRDEPDMPLKRNDHCMDAIRYICSRHSASSFGAG